MVIALGVPNESKSAGTSAVVSTTAREPVETRVAMTPDLVKRLGKAGVGLTVEAGAGALAGYSDAAYREAGAVVTDGSEAARDGLWAGSDAIAVVGPPPVERVRAMKPGAVLMGLLWPLQNHELVRACTQAKVTALTFDFVPRISRAQAVDALSAMASLAGYKAALLAANHLPRMLPMMMTAAGTLTASRVFVIGAGVAGLQAIATAKRLGAIVEAFDVRPAVKEQVESLGARFVELGVVASKEGAGGYATAQSADEQARQREAMRAVVAGADAVIATAAVPGKPAPKLIDDAAVATMKPGSVIVDLAAESGGNCTLTKPGETVRTPGGVTVVGLTNLAATLPHHASQTYARIVATMLGTIAPKGELKLDFTDEIAGAMTITHGGEVREARVRAALGLVPMNAASQAVVIQEPRP